MIYRFTAANFLSIAEKLTLELFPYGRLRTKKHHVYNGEETDILKTAAIYGGNGSGKSNLVQAIEFLRNFVTNNTLQSGNKRVEAFRFKDELANQPTELEVTFRAENQTYHYGVHLRAFTVEREYLFIDDPADAAAEPEPLFIRQRKGEDTEVTMNARFKLTEADRARISIYVEELLKNSESLLHLLAGNEAYTDILPAFRWLTQKLVVIQPTTKLMNLAEALEHDQPFRQLATTLLRTLDTGVDALDLYATDYDTYFGQDEPEQRQRILQELADGAPYVKLNVNQEVVLAKKQADRLMVYRVTTPHRVAGRQTMFFPDEESDGTRRVLDFLPLWHLLLREDATVVIDEIGRSLHPNLVEQLLRYFLDSATRGQLIFTTHDANLLQQDLFRRDEVWMMQKTSRGNSELIPLTDFKIREDLDLRKGYLNGRFGGVPQLRTLFPETAADHE